MKSVEFEEGLVKIAEHQEEYNTVHAKLTRDQNNIPLITICFELSPEEIEKIKETGIIWYQQLGVPMRPMSIHVEKPI